MSTHEHEREALSSNDFDYQKLGSKMISDNGIKERKQKYFWFFLFKAN